MKRTYLTTKNPDGSVTVESHGPIERGTRAFRWGVAAFLGLGCIVALFSWNLAGAAILLVLAAVAMPRARR